jgi:signal transduction histidine kinase
LRALVDRWLDPALAVVFLIAVEAQIVAGSYRRGPLVANAVLAAAIAGALALRRRWPLVFVVWSLGLAVVMSAFLTHVPDLVSATYLVFIPAYTVGAWLDTPRTIMGFTACVALLVAVAAASGGIGLAGIVFEESGATAAWALGRLMRFRRALSEALSRQAAQIVADQEDRARLALADERTRIARELQTVVAASISDMIVGAQAAERLLERDAGAADAAIASIEQIGRQALGNMRRILGVLRDQDTAALAPQPGAGQLYTLVERARASGRDIELRVEGEPAPVPARVDLAVYRIVQELLAETALESGAVAIRLDYVPDQVNLRVTRPAEAVSMLPAASIREWVALCGGALDTCEVADRIELHAKLPTTFDPVPA